MIWHFKLDEVTGKLTPASDAEPLVPAPTGVATQEPRFGVPIADDAPLNRFGTRSEQGPRHLAFHPTLRVLYTANEQGNSVTAYSIGADGKLTAAGAPTSTVPAEDNTKTHTSEIRIHPNGSMVFCR